MVFPNELRHKYFVNLLSTWSEGLIKVMLSIIDSERYDYFSLVESTAVAVLSYIYREKRILCFVTNISKLYIGCSPNGDVAGVFSEMGIFFKTAM